MDGEGVGTLDGVSDGIEDVLGPGEGEVEAAARAALLDPARREDASGWEGAASGGNSVDELAGWDGVKKEKIADGLRIAEGEDILPDNLAVDVLEGSPRTSPKDGPARCSRAVYLESVVDDLAASADAEAELPTTLREAVAHLLDEATEDLAAGAAVPHLPNGDGADGEITHRIVEGVAFLNGD